MTGEIARLLADFAVPFFFLCSGYFCLPAYDTAKIWKKALHIIRLTALGVCVYGAYSVVASDVLTVVRKITVLNLGKWLLLNVPFISCYHMWFLYALIDTYFVWMLIHRTKLVKYLFPMAIALIFVRFTVYEVLPFFTDRELLPISLGRSAWLVGLPFFFIGHALQSCGDFVKRAKTWLLLLVILAGAVFSVFSKLSIGVWASSVGLFLLALKFPDARAGWLSGIGKNHSMLLYLLHPLIGDIFLRWNLFSGKGWEWLMLPAIVAVCLLISAIGSCLARTFQRAKT